MCFSLTLSPKTFWVVCSCISFSLFVFTDLLYSIAWMCHNFCIFFLYCSQFLAVGKVLLWTSPYPFPHAHVQGFLQGTLLGNVLNHKPIGRNVFSLWPSTQHHRHVAYIHYWNNSTMLWIIRENELFVGNKVKIEHSIPLSFINIKYWLWPSKLISGLHFHGVRASSLKNL